MIAVTCWCEEQVVEIDERYVQRGVTGPCRKRTCVDMAYEEAASSPAGREILNEQPFKRWVWQTRNHSRC